MPFRHEAIAGPMAYTEMWRELRTFKPGRQLTVGIRTFDLPVTLGASLAAGICGVSEWTTPLHVFTYLTTGDDRESTFQQRYGQHNESFVIGEYAAQTGHTVAYPQPMYFHPVHNFITASPDAIVVEGTKMNPVLPVDAKTTNWRFAATEWGEEGTDSVPIDILMQAQQQMLVMGADSQDTVVMVGNSGIKIYHVLRNDDICGHIVEAATEMAQRILDNRPPEPTWTHPQTPGLLKALYGVRDGEIKTLDAEVAAYQDALDRIAVQKKELEKNESALKARIMAAMGEAAIGRIPGCGIEWTRKVIKIGPQVRDGYEFVRLGHRKIPKK